MTEEYAELLVGADVDLVVVPDIQFMYSTVSWPFSTVIDKTKGFKAKTTRRPIILNYPLSDSDRLLLHPLFAHELGHAAVDRYEFVRILEQELLQEADFVKALDQATSAMHKFWPASSPARIRRTLRAWLRAWTKEVMCDHLALEAAGPPFLWAMGGFVLPQRYSEPSHPPNTLRTKLALEHLDGNGWRQVMEEFAPKVTGWLDGVGADATEPLLPPFDFLRDQFLRRSDLWQDAARKRAAGGGLRPDPAVSQAKEAADLLDKLILPVGLDQPLLRRAILLGGWRDAFQRHGDSPQGLVDALADRRLQDLVGKAIEMTTVVASWSPP